MIKKFSIVLALALLFAAGAAYAQVNERGAGADRVRPAQNVETQRVQPNQTDRADLNEVVCTMEYNPVCGVDGVTYSNECVATRQNNVRVAHVGECGADNSQERSVDDRNSESDRPAITPNSRARNVGENIQRTIRNVLSTSPREMSFEQSREEVRERQLELTEERRTLNSSIAKRAQALRDLEPEERAEAAQRLTQERREFERASAEETKQLTEERREAYQVRTETEREEFKERLQTVQDENKRAIAERLNNQLTSINERLLTSFAGNLDRIDEVLTTISTRADRAEVEGVDVTLVREAVEIARASLSEANTEVVAQFDKSYSIEFNDNTELGDAIGNFRQSLRDDLVNIRALVQEAHNETRSAATILAQTSEDLDN